MPGKRKDFDGSFSVSEVNFKLDSPITLNMTDKEYRVYDMLWNLAVRERRETIPPRFWPRYEKCKSGYKSAYYLHKTRSRDEQFCKTLANLEQKCLVFVKTWKCGKSITVYGVKAKHPNLVWKDDNINWDLGAEEEEEKEKEKEKVLSNLKDSICDRSGQTKSVGNIIKGVQDK